MHLATSQRHGALNLVDCRSPGNILRFRHTVCFTSPHASTMPSRPMNEGRSNDHDFVPPTQYKPSRAKKQPPGFSPLKLILRFEAMDLNQTTSSGQIPNTIDSSSPEALFTLFFTDAVIDRIVRADPVTSARRSLETSALTTALIASRILAGGSVWM